MSGKEGDRRRVMILFILLQHHSELCVENFKRGIKKRWDVGKMGRQFSGEMVVTGWKEVIDFGCVSKVGQTKVP